MADSPKNKKSSGKDHGLLRFNLLSRHKLTDAQEAEKEDHLDVDDYRGNVEASPKIVSAYATAGLVPPYQGQTLIKQGKNVSKARYDDGKKVAMSGVSNEKMDEWCSESTRSTLSLVLELLRLQGQWGGIVGKSNPSRTEVERILSRKDELVSKLKRVAVIQEIPEGETFHVPPGSIAGLLLAKWGVRGAALKFLHDVKPIVEQHVENQGIAGLRVRPMTFDTSEEFVRDRVLTVAYFVTHQKNTKGRTNFGLVWQPHFEENEGSETAQDVDPRGRSSPPVSEPPQTCAHTRCRGVDCHTGSPAREVLQDGHSSRRSVSDDALNGVAPWRTEHKNII